MRIQEGLLALAVAVCCQADSHALSIISTNLSVNGTWFEHWEDEAGEHYTSGTGLISQPNHFGYSDVSLSSLYLEMIASATGVGSGWPGMTIFGHQVSTSAEALTRFISDTKEVQILIKTGALWNYEAGEQDMSVELVDVTADATLFQASELDHLFNYEPELDGDAQYYLYGLRNFNFRPEPSHTYELRLRGWTSAWDLKYVHMFAEVSFSEVQASEILVDTTDASGVTYQGTWSPSTAAPGFWRSNYRHDSNTAKGSKSVRFAPTLPRTAAYDVYMWYPARWVNAAQVPVDVVHAKGTNTVLLDQRVNGSQWNLLGTYSFNSGTGGYVRIRTTGSTGYVLADAVKFVPRPLPEVTVVATDATAGEPGSGQGTATFTFTRTGPTTSELTVNFEAGGTAASGSDFVDLGTSITFAAGSETAVKTVTVNDDAFSEANETVTLTLLDGESYTTSDPATASISIQDDEVEPATVLDNASSSGVSFAGSWSPSTVAAGYWGSNYRHDANTAKGTKSTKFTPNLPGGGNYQVYLWYPARDVNAARVPVDIVHAGGTTTVAVNQKINGGQWNLLGTFFFNPGTSGFVRIRTTGTSGYVIADAVKWVRLPTPLAAPEPKNNVFSEARSAEPAILTRGPDGMLRLEWATHPGVAYRVLRSVDGGRSWVTVFEATATNTRMATDLEAGGSGALFQVNAVPSQVMPDQ